MTTETQIGNVNYFPITRYDKMIVYTKRAYYYLQLQWIHEEIR